MTTPRQRAGYPFPPLISNDDAELATRLSKTLGDVWDQVKAREAAVIASANSIRRQETLDALAELEREVTAFQQVVVQQATAFAKRSLPGVYARAAMQASPPGTPPFSWTQFHIDAAQSLAADSFDDFLRRSQEAGRTSDAFARHVREVARDRTAFAVTGRQTAVETARDLERRLAERGITVATYADGSTRSMRTYTEMAVRTKTAVAHNVGSLNRYAEAEVKYVEVFDGAECGFTSHDDSVRANGRVVSLAQASAHPISHPNCRRSFGARPDVDNADQARRVQLTTTAAQRVDQAQSEGASAEAVARSARARPDQVRPAARKRAERTPAPAVEAPEPSPLPSPRPAVQRRAQRRTAPAPVPALPNYTDRTRPDYIEPRDRVLPPLPEKHRVAPPATLPRREYAVEQERIRQERLDTIKAETDNARLELARVKAERLALANDRLSDPLDLRRRDFALRAEQERLADIVAKPERDAKRAELDRRVAEKAAARGATALFDALPAKSARTLFDGRDDEDIDVGFIDRTREVVGQVSIPAGLHDDLRRVNPGYGSDPQFSNNCVHVVIAQELRRRGLDVEATPLPRALGTQGRSADEAIRRFTAPDAPTGRFLTSGLTGRRVHELVETWPPGARGAVVVRWRKGGGHIFSVEKLRDGRVIYYDGQNGQVLEDRGHAYFDDAKPNDNQLVRMDDLGGNDTLLEFLKPHRDQERITRG